LSHDRRRKLYDTPLTSNFFLTIAGYFFLAQL
jgi:hypothetical protein